MTALEETYDRALAADVVFVVDHNRAGNGFFKRVFDQHPEVLSLTWVSYLYSALDGWFNGRSAVSGAEVLPWLLDSTNVGQIAGDITDDMIAGLVRLGDDPWAIDRLAVRESLEELLASRSALTKREIIAAVHAAFAHGTGRVTHDVRYLLLDDSVTTASSAGILSAFGADYPNGWLIHLVRDPRAGFASQRQQYVNSFGSMYPLRASALWEATRTHAIWFWVISQTVAGARLVSDYRRQPGAIRSLVVRNEDLNLVFEPTMRRLAGSLGISWFAPWSDPAYAPTSNGRAWKGVSAYSRDFVRHTSGALAPDPDASARHPGPSRANTERWRTRLPSHEIALLSAVYRDELLAFGYQAPSRANLPLRALLRPWAGEIPGTAWTFDWRPGRRGKDALMKLSYYPLLPFNYVWSRAAFALWWLGHRKALKRTSLEPFTGESSSLSGS